MFHLNGFRLCRWNPAGRSTMVARGWARSRTEFDPLIGGRGSKMGELKAVLCQPVVCRGLITQTPMEKLLEGN